MAEQVAGVSLEEVRAALTELASAETPATMRLQCKQCLAVKEVLAGTDPHSVTWCGCCTQDHHHGKDVLPAGECEAANHPGKPCWHPPGQPDRPDGCTVCRPILRLPVVGEMRLA